MNESSEVNRNLKSMASYIICITFSIVVIIFFLVLLYNPDIRSLIYFSATTNPHLITISIILFSSLKWVKNDKIKIGVLLLGFTMLILSIFHPIFAFHFKNSVYTETFKCTTETKQLEKISNIIDSTHYVIVFQGVKDIGKYLLPYENTQI